jgi:hypothetical protein
MKNLYTKISLEKSNNLWGPKTKTVTLGSCFSQVIGENLNNSGFECVVNPIGIIFDPVSLFGILTRTLDGTKECEKRICSKDGKYVHHDWHSKYAENDKFKLISKLESEKITLKKTLESADKLILTFGTSLVFSLDSKVVANCHKRQQTDFQKFFLELSHIRTVFEACYTLLLKHNPNIELILAVSPIRHTRFGLVDNMTSKSILKVFCHEITQNQASVTYFPSFEIMLDELRDYRFYSDDLIHPNLTAKKIIWDYFSEHFFSDSSKKMVQLCDRIKRINDHKPTDQVLWEKQKSNKLLNLQAEIRKLLEE